VVFKIHGVISQITGSYTRLVLCFADRYKFVFITMIWIQGPRAKLLAEKGREMAVLPAVTAVLLHHSAMDIWTEGNVVSTG